MITQRDLIVVRSVVLLLVATRRSWPGNLWPRLAWLGGLFVVAALTQRGLAWWALAAPVAIAPLMVVYPGRGVAAASEAGTDVGTVARPSAPDPASRINTVVAAALVLGCLVLLPVWRSSDPFGGPAGLLTDAPAGIARHLAAVARPVDRVWNAQAWGSWLELTAPGGGPRHQ